MEAAIKQKRERIWKVFMVDVVWEVLIDVIRKQSVDTWSGFSFAHGLLAQDRQW